MVRERRGLALATVEQETRIPARRLTALEEERFDLLPERIYALGFLRTYAEYLGLDPQPYVDELSARLPSEDAYDAPPLLPAASRSRVLRPAIVSAGTLAHRDTAGESRESFLDRCMDGLMAGGMSKDKARDVCSAKWDDHKS